MTVSTTTAGSPVSATVAALRAAAERGDADSVPELLAPDVVFHSPLSARLRFRGRAEVSALHRDIFAVLDDLHTSEPFVRGDEATFYFSGRVRGLKLEAMNRVRVDDAGWITECMIFARPFPSLAALFAALPPRVATRHRGRAMGMIARVLTWPVDIGLRGADRLVPGVLRSEGVDVEG